MSQSAATRVTPRVLHFRLEVGELASPAGLEAQLIAMSSLAQLCESILEPGLTQAAAAGFVANLGDLNSRDELARGLEDLSRFDLSANEQMMRLLDLLYRTGNEPSGRVVDNIVRLIRGSRRASTRTLQVRRLTFQNPLDAWVEVAPLLDSAQWVARGGAALLLLRGLLNSVRYWQISGRKVELLDLEIQAKRADLNKTSTDSVGASDVYAIVELSQLLRDGATSGVEIASDDDIRKLLAFVAENPADALLAAGHGDTTDAATALRSIADVVSAELED